MHVTVHVAIGVHTTEYYKYIVMSVTCSGPIALEIQFNTLSQTLQSILSMYSYLYVRDLETKLQLMLVSLQLLKTFLISPPCMSTTFIKRNLNKK